MRPSLPLVVSLLLGPLLAACSTGSTAPPAASRSAHVIPPTPVTVGTDTVTVMGSGQGTFARLRSLIDSSRRSIHLEMYEFGRRDLAEALVAAQHRGVTVTVIDDPSVGVTVETAATLRSSGIDVIDYPVRPRMIDHVKLLVVDSITAVVGGINWGATSHRNHDFDAVVTGPVVVNLDRVFLRDLVTAGRSVPVPDPATDPAITVATTGPAPEIRMVALRLVEGAGQTIDMEQFVLTDTTIVRALIAARERGVTVRVLLDPEQRPSDRAAADLRDHGIEVRLYRGGGEKLHAKAAVADGRSTVFGSANWTGGGFARNHEVDLAITDSTAVAALVDGQMQADWEASAPVS